MFDVDLVKDSMWSRWREEIIFWCIALYCFGSLLWFCAASMEDSWKDWTSWAPLVPTVIFVVWSSRKAFNFLRYFFSEMRTGWKDTVAQKPGKAWLLYATLISFGLSVGSMLLYINVKDPLKTIFAPNDFSDWWTWYAMFWVFLGLTCVFPVFWKRAVLATATEVVATDHRRPILYLRPFKADGIRFSTRRTRMILLEGGVKVLALMMSRHTGVRTTQSVFDAVTPEGKVLPRGEELFVEVFKAIGPVVAIGKPGERFPLEGAARVYVGDEWRDVVHDYMHRSRLILMFAGTTPHFAWEIGKVFGKEEFVPTVILLPFFRHFRKKKAREFTALFEDTTGMKLPENLHRARVAYFPARDTCIAFEGLKEEKDLNAVNPFLGPLCRVLETIRPGSARDFAEVADDSKEKYLNLLLIASIVLFVYLFRTYVSHH